jgi:hypothetical protein
MSADNKEWVDDGALETHMDSDTEGHAEAVAQSATDHSAVSEIEELVGDDDMPVYYWTRQRRKEVEKETIVTWDAEAESFEPYIAETEEIFQETVNGEDVWKSRPKSETLISASLVKSSKARPSFDVLGSIGDLFQGLSEQDFVKAVDQGAVPNLEGQNARLSLQSPEPDRAGAGYYPDGRVLKIWAVASRPPTTRIQKTLLIPVEIKNPEAEPVTLYGTAEFRIEPTVNPPPMPTHRGRLSDDVIIKGDAPGLSKSGGALLVQLPTPAPGQQLTTKFLPVEVNVDNNNDGVVDSATVPPGQADVDTPGLIVYANDADVDGDTIPDWVDGIKKHLRKDGGGIAGGKFSPMNVTLPSSSEDDLEVRFIYDASDPADASGDLSAVK